MKKFAYLAFAFVLGALTSCTDKEDIEIIHHYDLSLNINTQSLYDQFDITGDIRDNYLRDGSRVVGILSYVYNSNGDLVGEDHAYLNNFNNTNIHFDKLPEGDYTIITIETLVNPDDNYSTETFSFDNSEHLSTFKITEKTVKDEKGIIWSLTAGWPEVIGVNTKDVHLTNNSSLDIKPEAIGAIVWFIPYNWGNSEIVTIGWSTMDVLNYYSLDPTLSREDRFNKNLTLHENTNVRVLLDADSEDWGCVYILEKDIDWKIAYQDAEVYTLSGVWETDPQNQKISDGQTYFIGTYLAKGGYIRSYFGDYSGLNSWKTNLDNTEGPYTPPTSSLFEEPYTNWNVGTVSSVKSYMANFTLFQDIQYDEDDKTYDMVYFDVANNYTMYRYVFASSTSGLTDAYVYLDGDSFTIDQVREEIVKQGYTYNSQNNNNYY